MKKTIRVWYLDVGAFEIPIIGTSGSKYEYSTDFMCKHKYLNIDDETVYSEDWTSNKEEQKHQKIIILVHHQDQVQVVIVDIIQIHMM